MRSLLAIFFFSILYVTGHISYFIFNVRARARSKFSSPVCSLPVVRCQIDRGPKTLLEKTDTAWLALRRY